MGREAAVRTDLWRIGLYIRLSREDGGDESLSVANQRSILRSFVAQSTEENWVVAGEYVDDGFSGTDHQRPGFQRLLDDIRSGQINCVICKNLSRAFRNYSDQGYFLESFFPRHATRFITLDSPKIDSFLEPEGIQGYEVPLSGVMNDRYAGRTSLDVRRTFEMKRRKGEFIGAFAPYGYRKDPDNKNRLLIDPEAARVVRDIFCWFLDGSSKGGIVRRLNGLGVPNPALYKRRSGLRYFNPNQDVNDGLWSLRTVSAILSNPVYIGSMVQGRQRVVSYKVHDCVSVPKQDWVVVEDTHEAIVDRETFQLVQKLCQRNMRTPPGKGQVHLMAGLVFCGGCGKAMCRSSAKGRGYFCCRTHREKSPEACTRHSIPVQVVEETVLGVIQGQIALLEDVQVIGTEAGQEASGRKEELRQAALRSRRELEGTQRLADDLYLEWRQGTLLQQDYGRMKARLEQRLERLVERVRQLEWACMEEEPPEELETFLRRGNITHLERRLALALIDRILVFDRELEIHLNFPDQNRENKKGT